MKIKTLIEELQKQDENKEFYVMENGSRPDGENDTFEHAITHYSRDEESNFVLWVQEN